MKYSPVSVLIFSSKCNRVLRDTLEALALDQWARIHAIVRSSQPIPRYITRHLASLEVLPVDATDEQCIATIHRVARREGTQALLPLWNPDMAMVAANRERLQSTCPVLTPEPGLLEKLVDKWKFAQLVEGLGLTIPKTLSMEPGLDEELVEQSIGFPMLVKPRRQEGGCGIRMLEGRDALRTALAEPLQPSHAILQEWMPGEDVALTFLGDEGRVVAVMMKKRWFTRSGVSPYHSMCDFEYFYDPWLEQLGRQLVEATSFSGIADFDLRVDFESRTAWFLECDPRIMGSISPNRLFGVNIPRLLVERVTHGHPDGFCASNTMGHFLSFGSIGGWLRSGAWRQPRRGPVCTNWKAALHEPFSRLMRA